MIVVVMLLEIAWLCLAGWAFFYTDDTCLADALALGIGLTLVSLSVSFQLAFLFGFPVLSFLFEASLLLAALFILRSRWRRLLLAWQRFRRFVAMYWLTAFVLGVCGSYLLLLALLLPVSNVDSIEYNLARVLLFQEQHTLLLSHVTTQHQAVQPVGSDIFAHMFLRFDTDYGTALFSFLAYLVIGFGSYALARRYATPQLALCATLIVISMPKMVYQATSTKNDLVSAAAALLCLLLLYRLIERPSGRDLLLLALMMSFGISVKTTFLAFLFSFVLLIGFVLIRQHGWLLWWYTLKRSWPGALMMVIPMLILSQVWLFIYNMIAWGGWTGSPGFVQNQQHDDGIMGATANLLRYLFECPDLLWLSDAASRYLIGQPLSGVLQWLYDTTIAPLVGDAGLGRYPFEIVWTTHEDTSGFGPMAFFVALPALGYVLLRGSALLRGIVLIQVVYVFFVAWQVTWSPWKYRFFALCFALTAPCIAYALTAICKHSRFCLIRYFLVGCSFVLLAYACAINTSKPLLSISALRHADIGALVTDSIWGKTDWGRDRYYYAREHFGDDRVPTILAALPPDSRVALVATIRSHWIYHYLLGRPDVSFAVLSRGLNSRLKEGQQAAWDAVHRDYDYLLCMGDTCQSLVQHGHGTVEQEYAGQLTTTLLRLVVPPAPE